MRAPVLITLLAVLSFSAKTLMADGENANFCAYVKAFVVAMERNRKSNIPFIRVDAFEYFDHEKSLFLKSVAHEIYTLSETGNLEALVTRYVKECEDAFPG